MKGISLLMVYLMFSCAPKVQTKRSLQVSSRIDDAQTLQVILKPFLEKNDIAQKISCDFDGDGVRDYVIVLENKVEKEIQLIEDAGVYEEVFPSGFDNTLQLNRHLLVLKGIGEGVYTISVSSDKIIPDRSFTEELNFDDMVVPSYLPLVMQHDILILTIQKNFLRGN